MAFPNCLTIPILMCLDISWANIRRISAWWWEIPKGKKKVLRGQGLQNWLNGLRKKDIEHVWESPSLSEDICWWFAQRSELMKVPCHYFLPPGGVDGQHSRARRRTRWCNEFVGSQGEHKWKTWGGLCIQSISKRIWKSWKADSDLEFLGYRCARVCLNRHT